jgi:hypothetical protein
VKVFQTVLSFVVLPVLAAWGDALKLKSGEVIEGRILENTADAVVIEVNFSPTIVETRTIPRADILTVAQVAADEAAFAGIKAIELPETALGVEPYDAALKEKLRPFLGKFPESPRTADVREKIKLFEAERKRIEGGEVKLAGAWLSASEHQAEKYQIDAGQILAKVRAFAAAQDWVATLNGCDLLQRSYKNSLASVEAIPIASEAVAKLAQQINFQLQNLPVILEQRTNTVERAPLQDRERVRRAMEQQEAQVAAMAGQARARNQRFYPLAAFDGKGLAEMKKSVAQVQAELAALDQLKLEKAAGLVRSANRDLADNELAAAEATIAELSDAWPEYEGIERLRQRLANQKKATGDSSQRQAESIAGGGKNAAINR